MNNTPENDKNLENQVDQNSDFSENQYSDEYDEFGTVFGDPSVHEDKPAKSFNKKRWTGVIACLLAVCILVGGTVAVIKLIPEKEEETAPEFKTIEVLKLKDNTLKSVSVKNTTGTYSFNGVAVTKKAESSGTEDTTTTEWTLEGYDAALTSSNAISTVADSVKEISATREITTKTAEDCGFNEPSMTVDVTTDESEFSIYFGQDSPDNMGVYLKLSNSEKIYIVESSLKEGFEFELLDLANSDAIPGVTVMEGMSDFVGEDGTLASFTSLTVTGKSFTSPVVIQPNSDELLATYAAYVTTSPTIRIAENVDKLFEAFKSGITAEGAYSFDVSAESLAKVGLNNPDFAATIKIGNHTKTYKFAKVDASYYAVVSDDSKQIKKVSAASVEFASYTSTGFYSKWVNLQSINDLSNFTVVNGSETHSFDIAYDDAEDAEEPYVMTYGGKKLNADYFKNYYQFIVGLQCSDFTTSNLTGEPALKIIYTNSKTGVKNTVEFRKASETKYQYNIDGMPMGNITSFDFNKIIKHTNTIIQNKDVK